MTSPHAGVHRAVEAYYTGKVEKYGATALGVDWPSTPSLQLRLVKLLKVVDFAQGTSLNDLGCGWGAALDLIELRHRAARIDYSGIDLSAAMIEQARRKWGQRARTAFSVGHQCDRMAHYSIASGIFNVKLDATRQAWEAAVQATLQNLNACSSNGFAVNFMLPVDDADAVPQLYRTEPDPWVAFCRQQLRRAVEIVEDYGQNEFTLLVR